MIRQIEPMLAYKPPLGEKGDKLIDDILNDTSGLWVYDEKIDGSRYMGHIGEETTTYTGRRYSTVTGFLAEITGGKLEHINYNIPALKDTITDGEYDSTSAASLTTAPYRMFDVVSYKSKDLFNHPLSDRNPIKEMVYKAIKNEYPKAPITIIPQHPIAGARQAFSDIIAAGGEGLVLKRLDSVYIQGGRSRDAWVKYKVAETFDVVITGYEKSTSDKYGKKGFNTFKHLFAGQYQEDGTFIEVSNIPATGFTDLEHQAFQGKVKTLIGKIAEVGGMGRDKKGIRIRHPRFLRWREDKNHKDCTIE